MFGTFFHGNPSVTIFGFGTFFHGNPSVTIFGFCKIDDGYPYLQRHNKLNLLLKMLADELPCILIQSNDCETCFKFKRILVCKTNRKARYTVFAFSYMLHFYSWETEFRFCDFPSTVTTRYR